MKQILTENTLRLQKLAGIITESQFHKEMNEGWRENILGAVMAASSMLGSVKGQNASIPAQQSQTSTKAINVPMGALFQSGRYLFSEKDKDSIAARLKQIGEFIAKNPKASFDVDIQSSESQVPNYDGESGTHAKLEPGQLAQKRAETVKFTLETFIDQLKKEGTLQGAVNVNEPTTKIGTTPYAAGENVRQDKFTREQYVNAIIRLKQSDTTKPTYKIVSKEGERYFNSAKHAIADVEYASRNTNYISQAGGINTGYSDVLVKWLDKMGKETGEKNLVPANWWNQNIGATTVLTDPIIQGIKSQPKVP